MSSPEESSGEAPPSLLSLRRAFAPDFPIGCAWPHAILILLLCSACPQQASNENAPSPAVCAQVGQRCEVSPGKLGSCVVIDNCRQGNCFVCQSQH